MRNANYQTNTSNMSVDYDDIIAQVKTAPREYLSDTSIGLREFVGSIKIDRDPLEIQKELRNEWN